MTIYCFIISFHISLGYHDNISTSLRIWYIWLIIKNNICLCLKIIPDFGCSEVWSVCTICIVLWNCIVRPCNKMLGEKLWLLSKWILATVNTQLYISYQVQTTLTDFIYTVTVCHLLHNRWYQNLLNNCSILSDKILTGYG